MPNLTCSTIHYVRRIGTCNTASQTPKAATAAAIWSRVPITPQTCTRKRRLAGKLVGSEARIYGVAAMLDIGRISVRGSIEAHSSIYRRHQRSARTKPALYVWYRNMVERILVWRWRTVLADSDGLAIAPQDTIHLPDHGTSPNACSMRSLKSRRCFLCSALHCSPASILLDDESSSFTEPLRYMRPALCICPSNVTRHGVREECLKPYIRRCSQCCLYGPAADVG
jgi:hypothetical protein